METKMPNNWKEYKIKNIGNVVTGKTPPSANPEQFGNEFAFVTPTDFKNYSKNIYFSERFISSKGYDAHKNKILPIDSIIVTCIGSDMGKVAINKVPCLTNQQINSIIPNTELTTPDFLYYNLLEQYENLKTLAAGGSTMPLLNKTDFENIELTLPPLPEQQAIAEILSSLDDKIELNLQTNKTLEEMANALYKHWFVDFGPFKEGKFVESELGMIPEGWEVKKVNTLFDITIGRTPPRKEPEWFTKNINDVKWISIKDMGIADTYIYSTSEYLTKEAVIKHNVPKIPENTVVLSFKLTVGRITITTEEMLSNEAIAHFIPKNNNYLTTEFTYLFLKNFNYESLGSTSSIATAVNTQTIKNIPFLFPDKNTIKLLSLSVGSLFEQIKLNTIELETLRKTRDYLLPKLISGEIQVKQATKIAKEVL